MQREWTTRRLALGQPMLGSSSASLLQASDWRLRASGWEALERALRLGRELPAGLQGTLEQALEDEHPGVRLAALKCLAAAGPDAELQPSIARSLSQEAWPDLRMALCEALERSPCVLATELSQTMLNDEDERVARLAERVFWGLAPGAEASAKKLQVLQQRLAAGASAPLWTALHWMGNGDPDAALSEALGASASLDPGLAAVSGTLGSALELAWGAPGKDHEVETLMQGWPLAMGRGALPEDLLWAAWRSGNEELARSWLRALDALQRGEQARLPWPSWRSTTRAEVDPGAACWSALVKCVGAGRLVQLALELDLVPELGIELLEQVGPRVDSWDWLAAHPQVQRWLGPGTDPALQLELLRACASTLFRTGDSAAGELLRGRLASGSAVQRDLAFQALANDLDSERWEAALFAAWLPLGAAARSRCAAWLPRRRTLLRFREALIEWGDSGADRSQALELLAAFHDDQEVLAALLGWLRADFDRLLGLEAGDQQRAWRSQELLVEAELRTLGQLLGEQPVPETMRWVLGRAKGFSEPVAQAAVRALGSWAQGRAELLEWVPGDLDPLPLAEACIALLPHAPGASGHDLVTPLIAGFEGWDAQLRVRLIQALGAARSRVALDFLKRIASAGEDFSERVAALDALARIQLEGTDPQAAQGGQDFLRAWIQGRSDLESRRVAVAALAREASPETLLWLLRQGLEARPEPAELGAAMPREDRELLRAEVLIRVGSRWRALASKHAPEESMEALAASLSQEVLRRPSQQAAQRLEERFEGRSLGAMEFEWRAELALASELASVGELEQLLLDWPALERLEAELLLALAPKLEQGSKAQRRVLEAGLVALHGSRGSAARRASARARFWLLGAAWEAGDFGVAAKLARDLRLDHRAGQIPQAEWARALGSFDRATGLDPAARLRSTEYLARAQAALVQGERQGAQVWLERARNSAGASRWARQACEKIRAKLQER